MHDFIMPQLFFEILPVFQKMVGALLQLWSAEQGVPVVEACSGSSCLILSLFSRLPSDSVSHTISFQQTHFLLLSVQVSFRRKPKTLG